MVWILQELTINLVIVFLASVHLPLFVMGSLKDGKEMKFCERILPNSINVIMYMEVDNNIFVDKIRHIFFFFYHSDVHICAL